MSTPIIEVKNVVKEYRLGAFQGLRAMAKRLIGKDHEEGTFHALDDVSFSINPGEVVGIIGHNGAGKSTLLKLLSGIIVPSSGSAVVRGKVSPLIEVGGGLIGDMTGRENIFLNASILGMPSAVIKSRMDEIIAFAELEQFIDTPVKRYSSGMQAKLGFAIATAVDSEILIIDEVLAVGDLAFQKKCFDRMESLIKREGKTVLLVSHNLRQITRMCSRAMLFANGRLLRNGNSDEVCNAFYELSNQKMFDQLQSIAKIDSTDEIELIDIIVTDANGGSIASIDGSQGLIINIKMKINQSIKSPLIIVGTQTSDLIYLSGSEFRIQEGESIRPGEITVVYTARNFPLKNGTYSVRCSVFDTSNRAIFIGEGLKYFNIFVNDSELNRPANRLLSLDDDVVIH